MVDRKVTFKGKPLTLVGKEIKAGEKAPDAELTDTNLNVVKLSTFLGKPCIISSVISLDTPVCDQQTHRFNAEATKLGKDIEILTLSMDLPFAQKRWCGASAGMENIKTLSDYRNADFGNKYGALIKELHLLTRAVFVVDRKGIVRAVQYVNEITQPPDYDKILAELKEVAKA